MSAGPTRLLLRVDAAKTMGIGHLGRAVAFAEEARARGWQVAVSGALSDADWLIGRLDELSVRRLQPAQSADELGALAAGFDVVLVDHYELAELRGAVNAAGAVLVSMEDASFGRRAADVVVDCGLHTAARPDDGSGQVLAGAEFVPVRDDVLAARRRRARRAPSPGPPRVVLVLGGGDGGRDTLVHLTRALCDTGVPFHAEILAHGEPEPPSAADGQSFVVTRPNSALPRLLADSDLVISAAGVTLLELCCIGVPSALVRLVDNQATGYRAALERGLAVGLGSAAELAAGTDAAVPALHRLLTDAVVRDALAARASAAVDGAGRARVLDAVHDNR